MKNLMKVSMLIAVFIMATGSYAQTKKGNIVVSGSTALQFNSGKITYTYEGMGDDMESEEKLTTFSLTPTFAYFIADDLAIGLASTFTSQMEKDDDDDKYTSSSLDLLPTILYYFPNEGKIRPFVQAGVGLSLQNSKYDSDSGNEEKSSASGFGFNAGGGIAYFIKDNISMDFGLLYKASNLTDGDDEDYKMKQSGLGFNVGLSLYF